MDRTYAPSPSASPHFGPSNYKNRLYVVASRLGHILFSGLPAHPLFHDAPALNPCRLLAALALFPQAVACSASDSLSVTSIQYFVRTTDEHTSYYLYVTRPQTLSRL